MPQSWEFWISNDPNSFSAISRCPAPSLEADSGKPSPPLPRAACLTRSPGAWPWNPWVSSSLAVP